MDEERRITEQNFCARTNDFHNTDASDEGWGVQLSDYHRSGMWTDDQTRWHVNRKELFTVYIQSIMVQSDNRTVISYLRNQEIREVQGRCCSWK